MPVASNFCEIVKTNLVLDSSFTKAGLLESLISQANVTAGSFQPLESRENGKKKTQLVRYMQPILASSIEDGVLGVDADPTYCGGTENAYRETEFAVNNFAQAKTKISAMAMASFCEGTNTVVLDTIKSMIRQLIKNIDVQLIAAYEAVRGNTSAGNTTPISGIAFSNYANLVASPAIMDAIAAEFFALDVAQRPIIVGGSLLDQYLRAAGLGCCNNFGQEVSSFTGDAAIFTDSNFTAATLGASPANRDWFVYAAGTVQFLDWTLSQNVNESSATSTQLAIQVGEDREFMVDLDVVYDDCNKEWTVSLTKFFGLMNVPADFYKVGDALAGVNYMLRFRPTTA